MCYECEQHTIAQSDLAELPIRGLGRDSLTGDLLRIDTTGLPVVWRELTRKEMEEKSRPVPNKVAEGKA